MSAGNDNRYRVVITRSRAGTRTPLGGKEISVILVPTSRGLYEEDKKKAWTPLVSDLFQESLEYVRRRLDELRELGVTSFTIAIVTYPSPNDICPLHYPSLTKYRADGTYTPIDLSKVFQLQESVSVLVVEHIWDVVPVEMRSHDGLLVRVMVTLGDSWESTSIVGYAGAIKIVHGLHNEPFILK